MSIVIDANMTMFAERLHISSSRMTQEYGLKTIDEIIEAEAAQGNTYALTYAQEMYNSPEKLIKIFRLADVENKFILIKTMDSRTRQDLLPMLEPEDLVMGLYFFNKDSLLKMLSEVDSEELVNVVLDALSFTDIIKLIPEEELANFFQSKDLDKYVIQDELKNMPHEVMQKFIESITGQAYDKVSNPDGIIEDIIGMPEDKFRDFMSQIDPDVQRQLVFQITKKDAKYLQIFSNNMYVNMLDGQLMKNEMIPSMIMLKKESLVNMISVLPEDLMSVVASQIDTDMFAKYLMKGHLDLLKDAWMM